MRPHRLARGGETEQTTFPARCDAGHPADLIHRAGRQVLDGAAVAFGDQRAAVGQKRDPPGHIEVGGDVPGSLGVRLTARFDVTSTRDDQHQGRGECYHGLCGERSCGGHRPVVPATARADSGFAVTASTPGFADRAKGWLCQCVYDQAADL